MRKNLEGCAKDIKFFRFRSPFREKGNGELNDLWLIKSLRYIDFTIQDLIDESVYIAYCTKGGISYNDLCNMRFDEYEMILRSVKKMIRDVNKANEEAMKNG